MPFLADVALAALRAQHDLPAEFDELEWREGFQEWTREQVSGQLPGSTTTVIEVEGRPVGRLRVTRDEGCIELSGIQLVGDVQGQGLGTAVIEALKDEAADTARPLELSVELGNPRARALYLRLGFEKVGEDAEEERFRWLAPYDHCSAKSMLLPPDGVS